MGVMGLGGKEVASCELRDGEAPLPVRASARLPKTAPVGRLIFFLNCNLKLILRSSSGTQLRVYIFSQLVTRNSQLKLYFEKSKCQCRGVPCKV